jgi:hypothetical protein
VCQGEHRLVIHDVFSRVLDHVASPSSLGESIPLVLGESCLAEDGSYYEHRDIPGMDGDGHLMPALVHESGVATTLTDPPKTRGGQSPNDFSGRYGSKRHEMEV